MLMPHCLSQLNKARIVFAWNNFFMWHGTSGRTKDVQFGIILHGPESQAVVDEEPVRFLATVATLVITLTFTRVTLLFFGRGVKHRCVQSVGFTRQWYTCLCSTVVRH